MGSTWIVKVKFCSEEKGNLGGNLSKNNIKKAIQIDS